MQKFKTEISTDFVLNFLKDLYPDVSQVFPQNKWKASQAFFFSTGWEELVLRINFSHRWFYKDSYAFREFSQLWIPIPQICDIGHFWDDLYYCVSQKVLGKIIWDYDINNFLDFVPQIIASLTHIHSIIPKDNWYGEWEENGQAIYKTWREYLMSQVERYSWFTYSNQKWENIIWDLLELYRWLIAYTPSIRHLIHGDYGFWNILSNGDKISWVIDWQYSKYWDYLYDIAWISFCEPTIPFQELFFKHYTKQWFDVSHYKERIDCYKIHFWLSALKYFSEIGDRDELSKIEQRLIRILHTYS